MDFGSFIVLVFGACFFFPALGELLNYYIICNCLAEGTVVRHEETDRTARGQKLYQTIVKFQIEDEVFEVPSGVLHSKDILLKEGSNVLIRFNPRKPAESAFVDYGIRILGVWFRLVTSAAIIAGLIILQVYLGD